MNLVTLEDIEIDYGDRQLLAGVDLRINEGDRIGLIGPNGSGKSTLLRVVLGQDQPERGTVTIWGGVKIGFLPQEPKVKGEQSVLSYLYAGDSPRLKLLREYRQACDILQKDPEDPIWQVKVTTLAGEIDRTNSWAAEAQAKAILARLGIDDPDAFLDTLSGGQGKRVALARALLEPADLLILDEPTNHIDAAAIDWLEKYLMEGPSALLLVTHDRYFLDRVVNRICEIDRRQLIAYPGNYQRFLELRSTRQEQLAASENKQQQLLTRELEWLRRSPMARSTKQKARKSRIEEMAQIRHDLGQDTIAIALSSRRLGKKAIEALNVSKVFGDHTLFRNLNFSMSPGDRLGIVGPNGAGKSTFLDILSGNTAADTGTIEIGETVQIGYYDQLSRGLREDKKVIDFINEKAPIIKTKDGRRIEAARMLEWFLFPRPQQQTYIGSLSGGEKRRLYLLWILIHQPNILFLDEPTNDLDIQTLQVLEQFLDHFQGCLLVISHDRYFLDRNVDFLFSFAAGTMVGPFPGPYDHFQQLLEAPGQGPAESHPGSTKGTDKSSKSTAANKQPAGPSKLSWKESNEYDQIEIQIADLEKEKRQLERSINEVGSDHEQLRVLAEQLNELDKKLELSMARWMELAEVKSANSSKS